MSATVTSLDLLRAVRLVRRELGGVVTRDDTRPYYRARTR